MSLFKKKIDFAQFVANLIQFDIDFLENDFNKMVVLADEYKILSENDKADLYEKAQTLAVVDILLGCRQYLSDKISLDDIGECVVVMYNRCLKEYKKVPEKEARSKTNMVFELVSFMDKATADEEDFKERVDEDSLSPYGLQLLALTIGFSNYFAGEDPKGKNWEGKQFAAFKLAKAITQADIVNQSLKNYIVIDN